MVPQKWTEPTRHFDKLGIRAIRFWATQYNFAKQQNGHQYLTLTDDWRTRNQYNIIMVVLTLFSHSPISATNNGKEIEWIASLVAVRNALSPIL